MKHNQIDLNSILNSLNKHQKDAVQSIEGPVMVLAGPGTGKTQILASRIAYIVKTTDITPSSILALTFTESGVKAMRSRLSDLLGASGLDVNVNTFHGFSKDIIDTNPDYFSEIFGYNIAGDLDRFSIVKKILESQHFDFLKPPGAPHFYIKELLSVFSTLKREAITPPVLKDMVQKELSDFDDIRPELSNTKLLEHEKRLGKLSELRDFYYLYQHELSESRLYDFDDMINLTTSKLLSSPDLLLSLQERYQYFHIDEFQDTNNSQLSLFTTIASYWGQNANVFVVGDPNQSIFRFQGANMENIINFQKTYPNCKIITLIDNYRSTDHILKTAHLLLKQNPVDNPVLQQATQRLQKNSDHIEVAPELLTFDSSLSEYLYIKDRIQKLIDEGVSPKDIAIIVKTNDDAKKPKQILDKFGTPCQFAGGSNLFETESVTRLIDLLRLVDNLSRGIENTELFSVLSAPYHDFAKKDLMAVFRYCHQKKQSLYNLIDSPEFKDLGIVSDTTLFDDFIAKVNKWSSESYGLALDKYLEQILLESGLLKYLENTSDAFFELDALRLFFDFVSNQEKSIRTVRELLDSIDLIISQNLKLTLESLLSQKAVTVSTAHKSKGLEWDYVFIPQVTDNRYGKKTDRVLIPLPENILKNQTPDDLTGEDLRLFYVAITRAKKQLILSYSQTYPDSTGKPSDMIASRFLSLLEVPETKITLENQQESLVGILSPDSVHSKQDISPLIEDMTLSASDLNTYQDCGYKYLLEKIYRIPETKNSALIFGTLVHDSLEYLYRTIKTTGKKPPLADLLEHFDTKLKANDLSDSDKIIRENQGKKVLEAYLNLVDTTGEILFLEKYFGSHIDPITFNGVRIVGKVDQIKLLNKNDKTIRVIDYKTGSPKTKNEVLGATKNSNEHIYNQLLFYDLLLKNAHNFPYKAVDFVVEFVESPTRDTKKFVSHNFSFDKKEIEDFESDLKKSIDDIKSAKFDKTTDLTICKLCRFKTHCYPNGLPS